MIYWFESFSKNTSSISKLCTFKQEEIFFGSEFFDFNKNLFKNKYDFDNNILIEKFL